MVLYQKKILDNGLTVIIHEDLSTPLVAINVLYKVGSKDEDPNKTGLTHLFEHLMFSGSANIPDFDDPIQLAGGENNAFTNTDITNFYNVLPAENIEIGLWLEADRMERLKLNNKSVTTQKKVVIEEFKETCLNEPYGDVFHHLCELAYDKHGYKWPTIGKDISHIESISLDDAKYFYENFYGPHNAILVLSGNISYAKGFELSHKWFDNIQGKERTFLKIDTIDFFHTNASKIIHANVPSKAVYLAFKMNHRLHDDFYIIDLLSDILSSGRSSRFYEVLIKEKQMFSFIDAYITGTTDPGLLIIDGKLQEGISIEEARSAIWNELDLISTALIDDRELEKIKNKAESNLIFSETSALNKSMSLAYYEYLEDIELINKEVNIYRDITSAQLLSCAKNLFKKENCIELIYLPN